MPTLHEYISLKLIDSGVSVFEPLNTSSDIDFAIRTGDGTYTEVIIREPVSQKDSSSFQMDRFRPRAHLFILCVTSNYECWLIPSIVFERFASGAPVEASWVLNLGTPNDIESLGERLSVYKDRWSLLSNYTKYKSTLSDPVALKVRIAMG